MWFEQEAAAAHLEQVRTDLVHDLVAGLAGGQPVRSGPPSWERPRRRGRSRRSLGWPMRRHETSYLCAHAMAHAGGLA